MIDSIVTLTSAPWKEVLQFAVTLFAILNPVAGASIYMSLVEKHQPHEKIQVARKAGISILIILLIIIWIGDSILNIFGISVSAFRIGGGMIVTMIGLSMLDFIKLGTTATNNPNAKDIAVVPLAIPIIAGPGVIAMTLTEMQNTFDTIREKIIISITTVLVVLVLWLILRFSTQLARKLGSTGLDILTKIMGMLLVVIATQMILEGLIGVFPAWVGN